MRAMVSMDSVLKVPPLSFTPALASTEATASEAPMVATSPATTLMLVKTVEKSAAIVKPSSRYGACFLTGR